ncbi:hypothetical protein K7185_08005 [Clostridium butyricum]|uniref:hypothetical protein n=1 Tax=Clostridium butyricum TaxID=1492 RepID=UPI001CA88A71|nr:hypothetical protein [Clostridium butyricum]MBZ0312414.1 hypothetical protein [Clostridium butyricum]
MEAHKVLLQSLYKKIILRFSKLTGKDLEESMDYFYKSQTYEFISKGIGDMHCKGVIYLTDELMLEYGLKHEKGYSDKCVHKF